MAEDGAVLSVCWWKPWYVIEPKCDNLAYSLVGGCPRALLSTVTAVPATIQYRDKIMLQAIYTVQRGDTSTRGLQLAQLTVLDSTGVSCYRRLPGLSRGVNESHGTALAETSLPHACTVLRLLLVVVR